MKKIGVWINSPPGDALSSRFVSLIFFSLSYQHLMGLQLSVSKTTAPSVSLILNQID